VFPMSNLSCVKTWVKASGGARTLGQGGQEFFLNHAGLK
jgi:hypothetical protein